MPSMFNWFKSLFAPLPPYVPTKTPEWKYVHTTVITKDKKMAQPKKKSPKPSKERSTKPRKEKKKPKTKKGK